MTERWRCFVAVDLDDSLRGSLADVLASWRADPPTDGLRWVEPENLHLTLAFLGEVEPASIPAIAEALRGVAARHGPRSVPTGRLGAFPRPGSARVLWYAVGDPDGGLAALAASVTAALGLTATEPFRPHITLARARRRPVDLRGWIEEASASSPHGRLEAGAIHLKRSHLGGGPARYESLAAAELGVAARV
jgi:RNA 2',3'-cyclic 3'-phosphodiesterase